MSKRESLLALAALARSIEEEFIAELPAVERSATGTPDDWSPKDIVAHVTTWRERGAEELGLLGQQALPPEVREFDEINRKIFDQNRHLSWDSVHARARVSWDRFLEALGVLPGDFLEAGPPAGASGRPLWRRLTVDAANHPALHYAEFARRRGRIKSSTRWMEALAPVLFAVDPSGEWHAVIHYNLACHYAQTGFPDKALAALQLSLELNPGLRTSARQDPDLAPLQGDSRFTTLVVSDVPSD
ncbi:MAG TPA: hypothetical protein VK449_08445 [Anaerolineales bacterium]|nr:hypothetical protein [Anaerolineales bacterium]